MLFLDGKKVSQLERKNSLENTDAFLISRNYNISTDNQFSKQVSFDTLAQDIEEKLDGNIMVSSMAYRETYEYARKNHGHDYSNVRVYMRPDSFLKRFAKNTAKIAEITTYNEGTEETFEVKIPEQQYQAKKYQPKIGELKFFATNTIPYIDIDSSNFDGWVYPDGSTYDKDRFPEAWKVYSTSQDSKTFQVPFLSTFFKPNPFPYRENSLSVTPGNTSGIPAHKHDTDGDGLKFKDADVEANVNIPGDKNCDGEDVGTKSIHARGTAMPQDSMVKDKLREDQYTLRIKKINITASGGKLQVAGDSTKTCPSFNLLPVKIFIGGVKK